MAKVVVISVWRGEALIVGKGLIVEELVNNYVGEVESRSDILLTDIESQFRILIIIDDHHI